MSKMCIESERSNKDTRIVYGMVCTWWDSIDKASIGKNKLPCCPYCESVLCEMPDIESFLKHKKKKVPKKILKWARGKCFRNWKTVEKAYYYDKTLEKRRRDFRSRLGLPVNRT